MKKLISLIVLIAWLFSLTVSNAAQEGRPSDSTPNPNNAAITYSLLGAWNSSTWQRLTTGYTGQLLIDQSSNGYINITTNATTTVKGTPGVLYDVNVNVVGTSSSVALYNVAAASCTLTPGSGYVLTLGTAGSGRTLSAPITFTNGICAVTQGTAAANITVLYR